jgi:hypothetical protein
MKRILKNWKTSLFGLGSIITGTALLIAGKAAEGVGLIVTGISGLFSKDSDVDERY